MVALKVNHPLAYEEVSTFLNTVVAKGFGCYPYDSHNTRDGDHDLLEVRRVWSTSTIEWFADCDQ